MLKKSGFKPPTKEKQAELQAKRLERLKLKQKEQEVLGIQKKPKNTLGAKNGRVRGKEKTQAQLKKELDMVFSKYIRAKFPAECYTCRATDKTLQCGHFVTRQYLATRWDENNCRPQCVGCNMFGGGKPFDFEERLKKELGEDYVENMKLSRHKVLKLDRNWYKEQIEVYKTKLENL